jgi:hypothetical protein
LVAAPSDCLNKVAVAPECFAQRRDLNLEDAFLDDSPRPDSLHQLVFAEDFAMGLDEGHQHVKRTPAELDWLAVGKQFAAMRHDPETAELDRRHGEHLIH